MADKTLQVKLTLRDELTKGLSSMKGHIGHFSAEVKKIGIAAAKVGVAFSVASAAAAYAIKRMMDDAITYGLELDKIAKQTSMTTEEFAKLSYAAKQEHANMESLSKSIPILAKYMEYARQGMVTYKREFDKMGISVINSQGELKSTYEILKEMAEYYKTAENKTQALAIATTLLGRRGAELVPLLRLGKDGIEALGNEAEQLGVVLSGKSAAAMKKFDDEMTRLKTSLQGVQIQLTEFLIPAFQELAEKITDDFKAIIIWAGKLKDNKEAIEDINEALVTGYDSAKDFIVTLAVGAGKAVDAWNKVYYALLHTTELVLKLEKINPFELVKTDKGWEARNISKQIEQDLKRIRAEIERLAALPEKGFGETIRNFFEEFELELQKIKAEFANNLPESVDEGANKIKDSLEDLQEKNKEIIDGLSTAWSTGWDDMIKKYSDASEQFKGLARNTAQSIHSSFSDVFFDAFTNNLKSAQDYFAAFGKTVLRQLADIMASWAVAWIFQDKTIQNIVKETAVVGVLTKAYVALGIAKIFAGAAGAGGVGTAFAHTGGFIAWNRSIKRAHQGLAFVRAHDGLATDEVPIIAQTGEGILSRRGMRTLGGESKLSKLNRGISTGTDEIINNVTINFYINALDVKSFVKYKDQVIAMMHEGIEKSRNIRKSIKRYA